MNPHSPPHTHIEAGGRGNKKLIIAVNEAWTAKLRVKQLLCKDNNILLFPMLTENSACPHLHGNMHIRAHAKVPAALQR